jgi:hypothetical protein
LGKGRDLPGPLVALDHLNETTCGDANIAAAAVQVDEAAAGPARILELPKYLKGHETNDHLGLFSHEVGDTRGARHQLG